MKIAAHGFLHHIIIQVGEGGRTVFPRVGAGVQPKAGSAVFWWLPTIFTIFLFTLGLDIHTHQYIFRCKLCLWVSQQLIVSEIAIASTDLASLFHMKGPQRVYSSPFAGQLAAVRICFHRPLIHHLPIFSTLSSNSEPLTQLSCLPTLNTLKYLFLNLNLHLCLLSPFRYLYL